MTAQAPETPDAKVLALLENAFAHHAGGDARIDAKELMGALGLRSEYLARRILAAFDANGDGIVDKGEFLSGARAIVFGTDRDKLLFAFRVHDHDGDGALGHDDLLRMITMALAESDVVERATQSPEQLTKALLQLADHDRNGVISFDELESVVRQRPALLQKMTRAEATWLAPNDALLDWMDERAAPGSRVRGDSGAAPWIVLALWLAVNAAIFAFVMQTGTAEHQNPFMQAGRALARCIDFNGALILLPMMRRLLTRLRATFVGAVLPIDDSIDFHKIVGHTLFALAVAHTAAFVVVFATGHAQSPLLHVVASSRGITGALLVGVFAVMWIFSFGFIRKTRHFELFYFTHLLYLAWFVLAIVHGPRFAFWAGVPISGFVLEQLLRLRRRGAVAPVVSARALRSGVVRLELAKPAGFTFGAGDYAFLRIPQISKHEWHPFTISGAPERDTLTFHVRSLGNWTSALRRFVETKADGLTAHIDGPYGSPSAPIFDSRFAVLIGAGIGVTPFASVLESLVLRGNEPGSRPMRLERAEFFWLNRDQHAFEWFVSLLSNLERMDLRGMLEFHLCLTGARSGATSMALELARSAMKNAGRSDIITGLRTHTHLGVPDWTALLGAIAKRHAPDAVDVFFCGPPGLAARLRPICKKLGMPFHQERF